MAFRNITDSWRGPWANLNGTFSNGDYFKGSNRIEQCINLMKRL